MLDYYDYYNGKPCPNCDADPLDPDPCYNCDNALDRWRLTPESEKHLQELIANKQKQLDSKKRA